MKLWPMARGTFWLSSGFGPRWGTTHRGLDLATNGGAYGTPIYAAADGVVVRSGPATGFGHWIVIDHQDTLGVDTVYGHMYADGLLVRAGDRVRAGQHIANVGSDGGSTGPHLHFEVWGSPGRFGGQFIDPEVWLEGAGYPGEVREDPVIQWGIDVSNHQGAFDFAAARGEGFTWATHKVSEGDSYADPWWPRARDEMARHFEGRFGGYVFCRRAAHPEAEADLLLRHLGDTSIPIQLDYEDTIGGGSVEDMWARIRAIEDRGMRVFSVYVPRWFWSSRMGSAPLGPIPALWNSHYVTGVGYASSLYPGDGFAGWDAFSDGTKVELLQFSETGIVAGQQVDVNAYRGSALELRALFAGIPDIKEAIMSASDEELTKRFPSRSKYRTSDEPVDTLAGMVLNIDARIHEEFVERNALLGVGWCIELVEREASAGDEGAQRVLDQIRGD